MADQWIDSNSLDLEAKLKSFTADVQNKIMLAALRDGAHVYQSAVQENTPEVAIPPTPESTALPAGALKSDVIISKAPNLPEYHVLFGKLTRHVAKWVDAGHRIVKGGRSYKRRGGDYGGPGSEVGVVDGKAFFRKAFETASAAAQQAIQSRLSTEVQKRWGKK